MVKDKATRIFVLTSAVAWCAMSCALEISKKGIPSSRKDYAEQIIARVNRYTGPSTEFGKIFTKAKKEYADCYQAYNEGVAKRRQAPVLKMPVNIVPRKSVRAQRKSRYSTTTGPLQDSVGGWPVSVDVASAISGRPEFYRLSWKENDHIIRRIGPLPLSDDIPSAHAQGALTLHL
jgi:hypothetical protein